MLVIATLSLVTVLAARWALRGGNIAVFSLLAFALGTAVYFALLVGWIGGERVFSGASLEALGVLILLGASGLAAAITAIAATWMVRRRVTTHQPPPG